TYNLVQYLGELGEEIVVRRNDEVTLDEIGGMKPRAMVISPGPGVPADAGVTIEAIRRWGPEIPTLGVCLGHQAIGAAFGGEVVRAKAVMHGKTSRIEHDGSGLFAGLPNPMEVMRYHSLVVEPGSLPGELQVLATALDNPSEIHAMRHKSHPIWGVQFHPESIMTPDGKALLANFLRIAA
ncbi:MAG: aminodeoxychorismate/anthranilate synthase component II, partial [Gemmatimonadota bacterium]|nr:aminodeoxychorismate/anthranilate synthase component II [Gemmatimonadota bacterium]